MQEIEKILIIRLRSMGDIVLTTPLLEKLKTIFPKVHISYMIEEQFQDLLKYDPRITELFITDRGIFSSKNITTLIKLFNTKYDLLINLHGGPRSSFFSFFSKATIKYTIKKSKDIFSWIYNIKGQPLSSLYRENRKYHMVERFLSIIKILNLEENSPRNIRTKLFLPKNSLEIFKQLKAKYNLPEKYCIIHPVGKGLNIWPAKSLEETIHYISLKGYFPILVGGKEDDKYINNILRNKNKNKNLAGIPLIEFMIITSKASFFVGIDSGPAHVACALGIPVLVLFGPTQWYAWKPWNPWGDIVKLDYECIGCGKRSCPNNLKCLHNITSKQIIDHLEKLLEKRYKE